MNPGGRGGGVGGGHEVSPGDSSVKEMRENPFPKEPGFHPPRGEMLKGEQEEPLR